MPEEVTRINNRDEQIDKLEATMVANFEAVDCLLKHRFTPGLYVREIFMPAGTLITSLIHKTTHPFFVLKGKVSVYSDNDGEQLLEAPFVGTTTPGTRRVLFIHEDCVWATCHKTDICPTDDSGDAILLAVEKITEEIIEKHENDHLGGTIKNNMLTKEIYNL